MTYATRRDLGTILHRPACWQRRQLASSNAIVSRAEDEYGPITLSGNCFRSSWISGPTAVSAQTFGPNNRACTRDHATKTTGKAPRSIMTGFLPPLDGRTVNAPIRVVKRVPRLDHPFAQNICIDAQPGRHVPDSNLNKIRDN